MSSILSVESAVHLLGAREMQLMLALFTYTGLCFTLYDSVLPTALGHLDKLGDTKNVLVGLAVVAAGEFIDTAYSYAHDYEQVLSVISKRDFCYVIHWC